MSRIVVVGAGAVGCFYAAQFILAGHDVRLWLRRDLGRVRAEGLHLRQSPTQQIASSLVHPRLHLPPSAFRACGDGDECVADGPADWVLVATKTTALADAEALLAPFRAGRTGVVGLCNGLGVEQALARAVGADRVFAMLCFVCVNRHADGVVEHLSHGRVALGHQRDQVAEVARLAALCASAGIMADTPPCLLEARWRKLAWNIPFNGLSVAGGGAGLDTAAVLADPALRRRAGQLMRETIAVANADLAAAGHAGRIDADAWVDELFARTAEMGRYLTSTLLDHRAGRALETDLLFGEPVRRAHRLGVPVPHLERLHAELPRHPPGAPLAGGR